MYLHNQVSSPPRRLGLATVSAHLCAVYGVRTRTSVCTLVYKNILYKYIQIHSTPHVT